MADLTKLGNLQISLGGPSMKAERKTPDAAKQVVDTIKAGLATLLSRKGMTPVFTIPIPDEVGSGHFEVKPIISKNHGSIMLNMRAVNVTLHSAEGPVGATGNGNIYLPKNGFTVDAKTFSVYREAQNARATAREAARGEARALKAEREELADETLEQGEEV